MSYEYPLALALSGLIGVSLGILGSGGSIITLPLLVYVAMIPVNRAVGMSLVVVGGTAAAGSLFRIRRGEIEVKPALLFTASGIPGAFFGSKLTHLFSPYLLLTLFGLLMVLVGWAMLHHKTERGSSSSCQIVRCLGIGMGVGLLTGFLGVGGGFLILPALVLFAGIEMKKAIGTSLLVIALNSFAGLIGQLRFIQLKGPETLAFLGMAILGMGMGLSLANRVSSHALKHGFAWSILTLGAFLMIMNLAKYLVTA